MTIKVTMAMSTGNYSWTETHYALQVLQFYQAVPGAIQLCNLRAQLLGSYATLNSCRLSMVPANRQTYEIPPSNWPTGPTLVDTIAGGVNSDQPYSSLMCALQSAFSTKNLYLAGIPDGVIQVNPAYPNGYEPSGNFANNLDNYMFTLTGLMTSQAAWGFRSRLTTGSVPVLSAGSQAGYGNNLGVVTAVDPMIPIGTEAYCTGFKLINTREPNLAGAFKVVGVIQPGSGNPNFTTVLGETGNISPDNFLAFGAIAPLIWQYVPYLRWRVVRATHRKRGGSYGLPRGRSRVRR